MELVTELQEGYPGHVRRQGRQAFTSLSIPSPCVCVWRGEVERKTVQDKRVERAQRGIKKEGGGGKLGGMWRWQESGKREQQIGEEHMEGGREDGEGKEEEEEQQTILLCFLLRGFPMLVL